MSNLRRATKAEISRTTARNAVASLSTLSSIKESLGSFGRSEKIITAVATKFGSVRCLANNLSASLRTRTAALSLKSFGSPRRVLVKRLDYLSGLGVPALTRFRLAIASLAIIRLAFAAAGPVYLIAGESAGAAVAAAPVAVEVTAAACEPSDFTVPSGTVTFSIHNASAHALEWEILDGVMVVVERENIPPGMAQNLTVKLAPGDYQITCGLLSNPKGSLHVVGLADAGKPSQVDLIGPIAEYRVYASYEIDGLLDDTRRLAEAAKSGDFASARASFSVAHAHYARLAPIAVFFPDLDGDIDSSGQADPATSGFRQLGWDLFANLAPRDIGPLADKLVADIAAMQARFENLPLTPAPTIAGAVETMGGSAPEALGGEADGRLGADLSDARADIEGVRKIVDLFRPLIAKSDSRLARALDDDFAALEATLARYRGKDGALEPTVDPSREDRTTMQNLMRKLSRELSQLPAALGLT
jgi:iron uptake system component EfeO